MSRRLIVAVAQSGPIHRSDSVIGFNPEWVIDSTGMRALANRPRSGAGNPGPAGAGCHRSATPPGSDGASRSSLRGGYTSA